jgi:PAP2 superfamily
MSGPTRSTLSFVLPALAAVALAACDGDGGALDPTSSEGDVGRQSLATLEWNAIARAAIEKFKPSQQAALRGMAYLTLAQYGAADAAEADRFSRPASTQGAIAGASAVVLTYLYPADSIQFDAEVREREAALEGGRQAAFRSGETLGRAVGAKAVALARADRFTAPWNGTVPTGPGIWFSSAVPAAPPVLPMLGQVEPFFLSAGNQFRPAPPPAFGSPAFTAAVAEVRGIAETRTARQDSIAKFWAMGTGSLIAGFWNSTAAELIERKRLDEREAAHVLALMNAAAMDGLIACAEAKFAYWLLRPSQADAAIRLAIGLPNFPSYPSNHACFSGSAAYVLGALFPAEAQHLEQMAYDAGISRVYGGIHYRFDSDVGLELARKISRLALDSDAAGRLLGLLS